MLNYPGSKFKVNLRKIENNLFELKKTFFLYDKFNNIESLEVINKSNNFNKINWKLEVITVDASEKKKIVKKFNIENYLDENLIIKLDILNENLNLREKKFYIEIKNKNNSKIEDLQMYLTLKNKYILEDFQIIDNIDNCYYIEKI